MKITLIHWAEATTPASVRTLRQTQAAFFTQLIITHAKKLSGTSDISTAAETSQAKAWRASGSFHCRYTRQP